MVLPRTGEVCGLGRGEQRAGRAAGWGPHPSEDDRFKPRKQTEMELHRPAEEGVWLGRCMREIQI